MSNYILQYKFLRIEQDILDDNQNIIGYANRYFRHIGQFFVIFIDPRSVLNVNVMNERRELLVQLKCVSPILSSLKRWEGVIYAQSKVHFLVIQTHKWKMGFNAELKINNEVIYIKDRTIGAEPHFFDSNNNLLAKCRDNFAGKVRIDIIDDSLNEYLIAAIAYLIKQY